MDAKEYKNSSHKEYAGIAVILNLFFVVFMGLFIFTAYSLTKAPDITGMIYDKVTLPGALGFVVHLKGVFRVFIYAVCCVPGTAMMAVVLHIMSVYAKRQQA